jgi:hypothetical protein
VRRQRHSSWPSRLVREVDSQSDASQLAQTARHNDQSKRLSVAFPPSTGPFSVEKFGRMASSATDGSSNVSVPTKTDYPQFHVRLPNGQT